ncbi:hypothetical protein RJ639_006911 [Escallonia herrerae]|uniref:Uncharacterized protein n=1 Tax=Escallonia herrerae TaxID=1293975 RepID=A0AA89AVK8_9ASTE|nr:hypothetical protein RJ639_006911 [Escallonia herrerae]
MSSSLGFHIPKALPSLSPFKPRSPCVSIISSQVQSHNPKPNKVHMCEQIKHLDFIFSPSLMNLFVGWQKLAGISIKATDYSTSKIPRVLLWAPFVNFRKLSQDPSMKYPWAKPQDTSQLEATYLKYPWAKSEEYDNLSL